MIRQLKNNATMKKVITIICLMFLFRVCVAPVLNSFHQKDIIERATYEYHNWEYEQELELFIDHLGYKESGNDWTIINDINCFGEWQFAYGTLKHLGYGHITPEKFRMDPSIFPRELQIEVLKILIKINMISISTYNGFIGKTIKGVPITKGGLIAGMHLGGSQGVKMYLASNGAIDKDDAYGTKISDYIREFSIYRLTNKNDSLKNISSFYEIK